MQNEETSQGHRKLSEIQHFVMRRVCEGKSNKEIAIELTQRLSIEFEVAVKRVQRMLLYEEGHSRSILWKLDVFHVRAAIAKYRAIYGVIGESMNDALNNDREGSTLKTMNSDEVPEPLTMQTSEVSLQSFFEPSPSGVKRLWLTYSPYFNTKMTMIYICVVILVFAPIQFFGWRNNEMNLYANIYSLIPFIGGVWGIIRLRSRHAPFRHPIYWAFLLHGVGLIAWSMGAAIWSWYNFRLGDNVPYPSLADVGYATNEYIWPIALFLLTRGLGGRNHRNWFLIKIGFVISLGIGLHLLYLRGWSLSTARDWMKFFFDFTYPVADVVSLYYLSKLLYLTPKLNRDTAMLRIIQINFVGMMLLFAADLSFSITTTLPEAYSWAYYIGGLSDFLFATAFYVLATGILEVPVATPIRIKYRLRWLQRRIGWFFDRLDKLTHVVDSGPTTSL